MASEVKIYIGEVVNNEDEFGGDRVQIKIPKIDFDKILGDIPYSFPLLPKNIYVKPKIGEAAIVFMVNPDNPNAQRFYLGPIIPQKQFIENSPYRIISGALLNGSIGGSDKNIEKKIDVRGSFSENEDVAIYGRKNSDIVLSENDVRVRAGVRLMNLNVKNGVEFNKNSPSFIKLKYNETPIITNISNNYGTPHNTSQSTATIYADKINLISPNGDGYIDINDTKEGISDKSMKELLEKAHALPYGDKLVDFLVSFLNMYANHSHPYPGYEPLTGDPDSIAFYKEYSIDTKTIGEKILSKDVKIN